MTGWVVTSVTSVFLQLYSRSTKLLRPRTANLAKQDCTVGKQPDLVPCWPFGMSSHTEKMPDRFAFTSSTALRSCLHSKTPTKPLRSRSVQSAEAHYDTNGNFRCIKTAWPTYFGDCLWQRCGKAASRKVLNDRTPTHFCRWDRSDQPENAVFLKSIMPTPILNCMDHLSMKKTIPQVSRDRNGWSVGWAPLVFLSQVSRMEQSPLPLFLFVKQLSQTFFQRSFSSLIRNGRRQSPCPLEYLSRTLWHPLARPRLPTSPLCWYCLAPHMTSYSSQPMPFSISCWLIQARLIHWLLLD